MPGGVGKVSETMLSAAAGVRRSITPLHNANEIFFNLDARRVYYDSSARYLYFVDTPADLVAGTIRAVLGDRQDALSIEQLHLDSHRFFTAARRVVLHRGQAHGVLVALRLAGIAVVIA
jgi:hypothetical protein